MGKVSLNQMHHEYLLLLSNYFKQKKNHKYSRKWVEFVDSPIVFCHNDLQGGNILLRHDLGTSGILFRPNY